MNITDIFKNHHKKREERLQLESDILLHVVGNSDYQIFNQGEDNEFVRRTVNYNGKTYYTDKTKKELDEAKENHQVSQMLEANEQELKNMILADLIIK